MFELFYAAHLVARRWKQPMGANWADVHEIVSSARTIAEARDALRARYGPSVPALSSGVLLMGPPNGSAASIEAASGGAVVEQKIHASAAHETGECVCTAQWFVPYGGVPQVEDVRVWGGCRRRHLRRLLWEPADDTPAWWVDPLGLWVQTEYRLVRRGVYLRDVADAEREAVQLYFAIQDCDIKGDDIAPVFSAWARMLAEGCAPDTALRELLS